MGIDKRARAQGCLLDQLAGDALGSLVEFQSPVEIQRGAVRGCVWPRGVARSPWKMPS